MTRDEVFAVKPRKVVVWIARAISYVLYVYLIAVEIILFLGFFLLLFGANPSAGFTQWAYRNLDRVMEPFRGIFNPIELGTTSGDVESVLATSVLFAMIAYGILALVIMSIIPWLTKRLAYLEETEAAEAQRRLHEERALAPLAASSLQPVAEAGTPSAAPASPPPSSGPQRPSPPTIV
jgi:uncharacterized protein YggT (Ycf19 family)